MDVACVVVRDLPIAVARRDQPGLRGKPVVAGGSPEEHAQVTACSSEAAAMGVTLGMQLRRALALCPRAVFIPLRQADLLAEAACLAELMQLSSPVVEEVAPGHLHMEVRGLARMNGIDDKAFLGELHQSACETTGLPVSLGAGESVFVAHAAAMAGSENGCPLVTLAPCDTRRFLAGLPVEVLPVSPAMHQRLHLLGLDNLRDVAVLPRSAMQAQFGPDGARAWDLAHGRDTSSIVPGRQSLRIELEADLPAPAVTTDALLAATRELLQRALQDARLRGQSLRQLDWRLQLEDGTQVARRLVFREPTRDLARMLFVLRAKVEQLQLTAAASAAGITLSGLCSEYGHQANLWPIGPRRHRELMEAIEQLNTREGGPQVYQVIEVQPWSRIPERQLALAAYGG